MLNIRLNHTILNLKLPYLHSYNLQSYIPHKQLLLTQKLANYIKFNRWIHDKMGDEENMKRKITTLFKDLCCSACESDFSEESVDIMREEKTPEEEMLVFRLACQNCGKSFGVAFLGISDLNLKNYIEDDLILKVQEGAAPINTDDVLDAHKFIKKLDRNWQKFIADLNEA